MLFRGDITQKSGAVLGNRAVFFLGGAVFAGRLHKSAMLFRCGIIKNYGVLSGKGVIFCPGWAGFRWKIAQNHCAFSIWNYIKLWSVGGEGGGFLPWVGGYLLGDSTKALRFFDEELYKIAERWRGRGWFFGLGWLAFVGG